jgi:hypothetical protein
VYELMFGNTQAIAEATADGLGTGADVELVEVGTFDTRMTRGRRWPGFAARGAGRLLHRRGFPLLAPPESFYVQGRMGSLLDGETDRASSWGEDLQIALGELDLSTGKSPTGL